MGIHSKSRVGTCLHKEVKGAGWKCTVIGISIHIPTRCLYQAPLPSIVESDDSPNRAVAEGWV